MCCRWRRSPEWKDLKKKGVLPNDRVGLSEDSSGDGDGEVLDLWFCVANRASSAMIAYSSRKEARYPGCSQPRQTNSEAARLVVTSTLAAAIDVKFLGLAQEASSTKIK